MIRLGDVDPDALLCALVLAPRAFARNRFFWLFERADHRRVRRRAARLRGILRHLIHPERGSTEILGERVLEDGRVLLRYRIRALGFSRTATLSELEAATVRYALHRAGRGRLDDTGRDRVERAIAKLGHDLGVELQQAPS